MRKKKKRVQISWLLLITQEMPFFFREAHTMTAKPMRPISALKGNEQKWSVRGLHQSRQLRGLWIRPLWTRWSTGDLRGLRGERGCNEASVHTQLLETWWSEGG